MMAPFAVEKLKQKDSKFKANLGLIGRPRLKKKQTYQIIFFGLEDLTYPFKKINVNPEM